MQAVGMVNVGGGGQGFGSGRGINRRSGGGKKPDTGSKMMRLSGQDFVQLAKGFGRVRDTLKEYGGLLECLQTDKDLAASLETLMTEESRHALVGLGCVIEYAPPPKENSSYQSFSIRNSARVTHSGFDVGAKDRTIGNAWRAAYESGICQKPGAWLDSIRDVSAAGDSSARRSIDDGNTDRSCGKKDNGKVTGDGSLDRYASGGSKGGNGGATNSGSSSKVNNYICETVPFAGSTAANSRISDSDSAAEGESHFRTGAAPASGGRRGGSRRAVSYLDDGISDDGTGGGSGDQATIKDTNKSLPSEGEHFEAAFGARVLVLFDDGNRYWGTINNRASSMQDRRHPDGPWSVLFDDCTQERFRDGDKDFIVTNKPRLKRMTMAQQEFYLKHPNGVQLLEHVKNLSVGPGATARRHQEQADRSRSSGPPSAHAEAAHKSRPKRAGPSGRSTPRKYDKPLAPKRPRRY